jgi:regulator of replication initiation timing
LEGSHDRVGVGEVAQANKQLRAEADQLKQRIQMPEQENRQLSEASEAVKRDTGEALNAA